MKWFVCLFSFYLLALSGVTCGADSDCCKDEISQHADSGRTGDEKPKNMCVPFLACGACYSILPALLSVALPSVTILARQVFFRYLNTAWTDATGSIWQPPQLS